MGLSLLGGMFPASWMMNGGLDYHYFTGMLYFLVMTLWFIDNIFKFFFMSMKPVNRYE
jgi:hypothetical protein